MPLPTHPLVGARTPPWEGDRFQHGAACIWHLASISEGSFLSLSNGLGATGRDTFTCSRKFTEDLLCAGFWARKWWNLLAERYFSAKLDLEGRGLAGGAAVERTQGAKSIRFVIQCLLSRFSLIYDIQIQKKKDSTYL